MPRYTRLLLVLFLVGLTAGTADGFWQLLRRAKPPAGAVRPVGPAAGGLARGARAAAGAGHAATVVTRAERRALDVGGPRLAAAAGLRQDAAAVAAARVSRDWDALAKLGLRELPEAADAAGVGSAAALVRKRAETLAHLGDLQTTAAEWGGVWRREWVKLANLGRGFGSDAGLRRLVASLDHLPPRGRALADEAEALGKLVRTVRGGGLSSSWEVLEDGVRAAAVHSSGRTANGATARLIAQARLAGERSAVERLERQLVRDLRPAGPVSSRARPPEPLVGPRPLPPEAGVGVPAGLDEAVITGLPPSVDGELTAAFVRVKWGAVGEVRGTFQVSQYALHRPLAHLIAQARAEERSATVERNRQVGQEPADPAAEAVVWLGRPPTPAERVLLRAMLAKNYTPAGAVAQLRRLDPPAANTPTGGRP